ncbi:hypothetical protein DFS34DRAFT_149548 [Phlyctochytrium arcticum]|nr:hypothetical protein DFS34DRAFT_149548 [Phlyctochytrium arcticum]
MSLSSLLQAQYDSSSDEDDVDFQLEDQSGSPSEMSDVGSDDDVTDDEPDRKTKRGRGGNTKRPIKNQNMSVSTTPKQKRTGSNCSSSLTGKDEPTSPSDVATHPSDQSTVSPTGKRKRTAKKPFEYTTTTTTSPTKKRKTTAKRESPPSPTSAPAPSTIPTVSKPPARRPPPSVKSTPAAKNGKNASSSMASILADLSDYDEDEDGDFVMSDAAADSGGSGESGDETESMDQDDEDDEKTEELDIMGESLQNTLRTVSDFLQSPSSFAELDEMSGVRRLSAAAASTLPGSLPSRTATFQSARLPHPIFTPEFTQMASERAKVVYAAKRAHDQTLVQAREARDAHDMLKRQQDSMRQILAGVEDEVETLQQQWYGVRNGIVDVAHELYARIVDGMVAKAGVEEIGNKSGLLKEDFERRESRRKKERGEADELKRLGNKKLTGYQAVQFAALLASEVNGAKRRG